MRVYSGRDRISMFVVFGLHLLWAESIRMFTYTYVFCRWLESIQQLVCTSCSFLEHACLTGDPRPRPGAPAHCRSSRSLLAWCRLEPPAVAATRAKEQLWELHAVDPASSTLTDQGNTQAIVNQPHHGPPGPTRTEPHHAGCRRSRICPLHTLPGAVDTHCPLAEHYTEHLSCTCPSQKPHCVSRKSP